MITQGTQETASMQLLNQIGLPGNQANDMIQVENGQNSETALFKQ